MSNSAQTFHCVENAPSFVAGVSSGSEVQASPPLTEAPDPYDEPCWLCDEHPDVCTCIGCPCGPCLSYLRGDSDEREFDKLELHIPDLNDVPPLPGVFPGFNIPGIPGLPILPGYTLIPTVFGFMAERNS